MNQWVSFNLWVYHGKHAYCQIDIIQQTLSLQVLHQDMLSSPKYVSKVKVQTWETIDSGQLTLFQNVCTLPCTNGSQDLWLFLSNAGYYTGYEDHWSARAFLLYVLVDNLCWFRISCVCNGLFWKQQLLELGFSRVDSECPLETVIWWMCKCIQVCDQVSHW